MSDEEEERRVRLLQFLLGEDEAFERRRRPHEPIHNEPLEIPAQDVLCNMLSDAETELLTQVAVKARDAKLPYEAKHLQLALAQAYRERRGSLNPSVDHLFGIVQQIIKEEKAKKEREEFLERKKKAQKKDDEEPGAGGAAQSVN